MLNDSQSEAMATFKTGLVRAVKKGFVRVHIPEFEDFVTDWLPVLIFGDTQNNKSFAMPAIGAQVALLMDARGEDGVCLGSIYSDVDVASAPHCEAVHTQFSDGAVVEYDPLSSTLSATGFQNAILEGGTVTIKADQTTFDSPVTINGALVYTAGLTGSGGDGATMSGNLKVSEDVTADGVSFIQHVHGGVLAGGAKTTPPD